MIKSIDAGLGSKKAESLDVTKKTLNLYYKNTVLIPY